MTAVAAALAAVAVAAEQAWPSPPDLPAAAPPDAATHHTGSEWGASPRRSGRYDPGGADTPGAPLPALRRRGDCKRANLWARLGNQSNHPASARGTAPRITPNLQVKENGL